MEEAYQACLLRVGLTIPSNKHARENLRQQMQRLRDPGLINFLGKGRYQFPAPVH